MTAAWLVSPTILFNTAVPLRDILTPEPRVLFVGINPSLRSEAVGHHFAGPGNPFWRLLYAARLVPVELTHTRIAGSPNSASRSPIFVPAPRAPPPSWAARSSRAANECWYRRFAACSPRWSPSSA